MLKILLLTKYFSKKFDEMSFFGNNIKKIRSVKKLSQSKFAELFNLTRSAIGAYEEGRAEAKIDKIIEITDYFGLTLDQLLKKKLTLNEIFHYDSKKKIVNSNLKFGSILFIEYSKQKQYLKNFDNKEFIDRLSEISLPEIEPNNRAFEVKNLNHFLDGDILICEQCDKNILGENYYLLISKNNMTILDKIPGKIHYEEIWRVKSVISKNIAKFKILEQLSKLNKTITSNTTTLL